MYQRTNCPGIGYLVLMALLLIGPPASAADWPQWRYDASRSASSPEQLPETLHLQWVRQYPPQEVAWPQQVQNGFLLFDVSYKPVVASKRMFVGSAANHRLTALDTETGNELWRFYADGPIRFAPVATADRVYLVSDDGWLYCLTAADGSLQWRYRGGPDNRKILGQGHLVGQWPARGGPALADGIVYFGASLWPFMGSFLHAVDAQTGKAVWVNGGIGAQWKAAYALQGSGMMVRPGMYGSCPQGYLVVADNRLGVPQGRNVAQMFDRQNGKLMFNEVYGMHEAHNSSDYWFALTAGRSIFSGPMGSGGVGLDTGKLSYANPVGHSITDAKTLYQVTGGDVAARSAENGFRPLWKFRLSSPAAPTTPGSYIKAGKNLYLPGAQKQVLIVKDVDAETRSLAVGPKIVGDSVWDMLAANGKLFVVTRDGQIACYGGNAAGEPKMLKDERVPAAESVPSKIVADILKASGPASGYCLVLGLKDGSLAEGLARASNLQIVAVDPDAKKVEALRRRMDAAGLYGKKISAHVGEPLADGLPSYMASLVVSETLDASALEQEAAKAEMKRVCRPYGGAICLAKADGTLATTVRQGAPEGAAEWTHNNADAGNSMAGTDKLAKPPLGVLWFGGPTNDKVLPRHGRGPAPAVAAGRLVIEGRDILRAIDIYTGRLLWEREFPGVGTFYDTGGKQLGTHETGPNYAMTLDAVYVITPGKCLELNAATGETTKEFLLPDGVQKDALWATVRATDKYLVATLLPVDVKRDFKINNRQGASAQWLAAYDRQTGKNLWVKKAVLGWRSNGVAVAKTQVYCIDGLSATELQQAKKLGAAAAEKSAMYAFEAADGKQAWKYDQDVFGTWLGYSAEHDVVVQSGCGGGDPTALAVHKCADGSRLWRCPENPETKGPDFVGPPMLHHGIIMPQYGQAIGLMDGKLQTRDDPLTGKALPWMCAAQGCGFTHAGEYMTLHRAWSTAGYTEFINAPRIVGLGGFRSGCTANMVPAGGVVTAPEYTRECECQFPHQTSVGLIHMGDADAWGFEMNPPPMEGRIRRLGLNFGAPGDRTSDDGVLWLDCPDVGGPSRQVAVEFTPSREGARRNWIGNPHWRSGQVRTKVFGGETFCQHTSWIKDGPLKWVTASGILGVESLKIRLFYPAAAPQPARYTLRLYFAEPGEDAQPGSRIFSIACQGKPLLTDFDLVKEASGPRRGIVREFKGIAVADLLTLEFTAKVGKSLICGLEILSEE